MKRIWRPVAGVMLAAPVLTLGFLECGYRSETDAMADDAQPLERHMRVELTPVSTRMFEERVAVQGNLEAKNSANVSARLPGIVERILVEEGDIVAIGDALFESDAVKVEKAVEASKHDLAVARCAKREKDANLERVQADLDKAEIDVQRFERLHKTGSVPLDALEQQQSRFKQTKAMLKHARSLVDLGTEQVRQAEAGLAIVEKDLSDAIVYAPIAGSVNMRFIEPGEMVGVGDAVVRIEDTSLIEVSAFLPAHYYPRTVPGTTLVRVKVYGIDAGECVLSYKTPTVNPKLRTFEVKCILSGPPEGVVPGAMADIEVVFERHEAPGVPAGAIQIRGGRDVVFVSDNGTARMVAVETGLETDSCLELRGNTLAEGTPVVTMGQSLLRDGMILEEVDSGQL